jgi:hypothetical protein
MLIRLQSNDNIDEEYCLLEFQGELVGELPGAEIGQLVVLEVNFSSYILQIDSLSPFFEINLCIFNIYRTILCRWKSDNIFWKEVL